VLQSLSKGVPVVATKTSGWANAIERHGCGVVWEDRSVPLADACRSAAPLPAQRCRALVEEFAPERQKDVLIGAYEEILAGAGRVTACPRLVSAPEPETTRHR
jgi:glycosyltransferase involved in cell wall biosynthesis